MCYKVLKIAVKAWQKEELTLFEVLGFSGAER